MIFNLQKLPATTALTFVLFCFAFAQVPKTSTDSAEDESVNSSRSEIDSISLIHIGDLVDVDVVGSTEFDWRGEVTSDGFFGGLSFTDDPVFALCRKPPEVADEIKRAYSKFLNDPEVNVEILDKSKRPLATVFGAVRQPQRFRLMRSVSLKELLVKTGGFAENASGIIEIVSQPLASCHKVAQSSPEAGPQKGEAVYVNISISDILAGKEDANPNVAYGDVVTVLAAAPVYVIGDVLKPGQVPMSEGLTVKRAISAAGGMLGKEKKSSIRLFRRNPEGTDIIEIDSGTESNENADEFVLKGYDIIQVFGSGDAPNQYPPVLNRDEAGSRTIVELPIRTID